MLRISRRLIDVTGMRDIVQRRIPLLTLDSRSPGPVVWLTGCIHGDEPGGAAIIHDVFRMVRRAGMSMGAIHALPLINLMGFENVSRFVNSDHEDLNRCFPGNARGTMGERFAQRVFGMITDSGPDLVIDLHNDWIQSVPYAVIESPAHFPSRRLHQRTVGHAASTGLLIVQDSDPADEMARTLTGALNGAGIPALTIEAGGACGIVESAVEAGRSAVLGALADLGMLSVEAAGGTRPRKSASVLNYTSRPRCASSGIVRFLVTPGERIQAERKVAEVYSAFGSVEESLHAARAGYVLGVADHARVMPGSEVIAIAELDTGSEAVPGDRPAKEAE